MNNIDNTENNNNDDYNSNKAIIIMIVMIKLIMIIITIMITENQNIYIRNWINKIRNLLSCQFILNRFFKLI